MGQTGMSLKPFDIQDLYELNDAVVLYAFGNTESMKKFLPNMNLSSKNAAEEFLKNLVLKTEMKIEFGYAIRYGQSMIGMILVETPAFNNKAMGFPQWTCDFFILEPFQHKKMISVALPYMLNFLKLDIGINNLYFLVDPTNIPCLNFLRTLPFDEVDNADFSSTNSGNVPKVFLCQLNDITLLRK